MIRPDRPMMSAPSTLALRQDVLARHHHAHVDDLEVVALEHDGDDVLADVVHVALDGGDDDLALGLGLAAGVDQRAASRPRCRAAGGPPPASSRAPTSPPAAGTSCPGRTGRRRCSCRPSAGLRSRAAAGRPWPGSRCQASSVSSTMKSVMPCTSACDRRCSDRCSRAPGELARCRPWRAPLARSAISTRRSPASGRRLSTTSSTRSRSSGSRSS